MKYASSITSRSGIGSRRTCFFISSTDGANYGLAGAQAMSGMKWFFEKGGLDVVTDSYQQILAVFPLPDLPPLAAD